MNSFFYGKFRSFLVASTHLALAFCIGANSSFAQETPEIPAPNLPTTPVENPPGATSQGREATPTDEPEGEETPGTRVGVELFYGVSNLSGSRTFKDGFWIGSGPGFPSVAYARHTARNGATAKFSLAVGDLYDSDTLDQPVEAWYQRPVGGWNITAGKFYVPFEIQEWQYETKWGLMAQRTVGKWDFAGSANYNFNSDTTNFYGRIGHTLNDNVSVGLSLGGGRGFSYDSTHDKGVALDLSANYRNFELLSSYLALRGADEGPFDFGFAKLSYTDLGRVTPFVSYHRWRDRSDQLGSFHSATAGAAYQLTNSLALEAGVASAPDRDAVTWAQIHWTQEW